MDRREFLRLAGLTLVEGVFGSAVISLLMNASKTETSLTPSDVEKIRRFYPQLEGKIPTQKIEFTSQTAEATLYNFTQHPLNKDILIKAQNYFDEIALSPQSISYAFGQNEFNFSLSPAHRSQKTIIIVPPNTPSPEILKKPVVLGPDYPAVTYEGFPDEYVTFITEVTPDKLGPDYSTVKEKLSAVLLTEMCQNSIVVKSNPPEYQTTFQEVACNGLRRAMVWSLEGRKYNDYLASSQNLLVFGVPILTVEEFEYVQMQAKVFGLPFGK